MMRNKTMTKTQGTETWESVKISITRNCALGMAISDYLRIEEKIDFKILNQAKICLSNITYSIRVWKQNQTNKI